MSNPLTELDLPESIAQIKKLADESQHLVLKAASLTVADLFHLSRECSQYSFPAKYYQYTRPETSRILVDLLLHRCVIPASTKFEFIFEVIKLAPFFQNRDYGDLPGRLLLEGTRLTKTIFEHYKITGRECEFEKRHSLREVQNYDSVVITEFIKLELYTYIRLLPDLSRPALHPGTQLLSMDNTMSIPAATPRDVPPSQPITRSQPIRIPKGQQASFLFSKPGHGQRVPINNCESHVQGSAQGRVKSQTQSQVQRFVQGQVHILIQNVVQNLQQTRTFIITPAQSQSQGQTQVATSSPLQHPVGVLTWESIAMAPRSQRIGNVHRRAPLYRSRAGRRSRFAQRLPHTDAPLHFYQDNLLISENLPRNAYSPAPQPGSGVPSLHGN